MWPRFGRTLVLGVLLACGRCVSAAEQGLPVVQNYRSGSLPIKDAVLSLASTEDGCLFVGSNQLTVFDGHQWQTLDIADAYGFRALAPDSAPSALKSGRVWVGAIGLVGYVERKQTTSASTIGAWRFVSLLPQLQAAGIVNPGDVWTVHPMENGAAFVTSNRVLLWTGKVFKVWNLPTSRRLIAYPVGSELFIYQDGVGLLRFDPDGPKLIRAEAGLPAKADVISILPVTGGQLLIFPDSVFLQTRENDQRLDELSDALRYKLAVCAAKLADGTVAIGTFLGGVVLASADGKVKAIVDSTQGLGEDNVNAILADARNNLWIGLGNGLSCVEGVGQSSVFDRRNGLGSSAARKVLVHEGTPWLLTSRNLFRLAPAADPQAVQLAQIADLQAMLWDSVSFDHRLWIGGFGGIWQLGEKGLVREHLISADVLHLASSKKMPNAVIFTEDYALKALQPVHDGWVSQELGPKLPDTPVSLVEDTNGDVWASTMVGGIYRFSVVGSDSAHPLLQAKTSYRQRSGLPQPAKNPRLSLLGSRLFAFTETDILRLDNRGGAFEPVPGAQQWIGIAAVADGSDAAYWIVQSRRLSHLGADAYALLHVKINAEELVFEPLRAPGLDRMGRITNLNLTADGFSSALWVSGSLGFLRLEASALQPALALRPPRLEIVDREAEQTPQAKPAAKLVFDSSTRRFEFRFPSPQTLSEGAEFYQTLLSGVDTDWTPAQREPQREFSGLGSGAYLFKARTIDRYGRVSLPVVCEFDVLAPWYRRTPLIVGYFILLGLAIYGIVLWRISALQHQTEKLNQLVSDRTRELALSNTAKSEFLENISHEIRNPLNGIVGLMSMMSDENLPHRERELSRSLKTCVQSLERVFEEILNFSKLEYGYVSVEETPFHLAQAIDDVIRLFSVSAKDHGNAVTLLLPVEFRDGFLSDERKIKTIIGNLLGNAIKYAPGAPIEIQIEMERDAMGRDILTIEVRDHGPGIPAEEHELIFEKFVRGSNTRVKEVPGTGLGLATCQVLARFLHGSVGVESEPGHGATFFLRLPLKRVEITAVEVVPQTGSSTPSTSALIVEDEDYNRIVLKGITQELGYTVELAANANEALSLVDTKAFGLVLLDQELPGMKGLEAARRLRAKPDGTRSIVIAITAHDSDEARRRCLDAGMDEFALKPLNAAKLRALIDAVQVRRNGHAAPDSPAAISVEGLDLSVFELYSRTAPDRAAHAVKDYIETLDQLVVSIGRAARVNDAETVARCAHRLCAHAGLIGARRLCNMAERLTKAARAGDLREYIDALPGEASSLKEQIHLTGESAGLRG